MGLGPQKETIFPSGHDSRSTVRDESDVLFFCRGGCALKLKVSTMKRRGSTGTERMNKPFLTQYPLF